MKKEAQVSIETMVSVSVLLLVFLLSLVFTYAKRSELITTERYIDKKKECNLIANTISQAKTLGPGTESRIFLFFNASVYNKSSLIEVYDERSIAYCNFEQARIANYTGLIGNISIINRNNIINITRLP